MAEIDPEDILRKWRELGRPSNPLAIKRAFAEEDDRNVPLADIREWLRRNSTRQVFAPRPKYGGRVFASRPGERMAVDLVDFSNRPSPEGHRYIVVLQDVFSRKVWARPIDSKVPQEVADALQALLDSVGTAPGEITGDRGAEFVTPPVQELMRRRGIAFREKLSPNDTGPLDAAISKLKTAIFKRFADTRDDGWHVADAVAGINRRPQESYLNGNRPDDVWYKPGQQPRKPNAAFDLQAMNGILARASARNTERLAALLDRNGAFRTLTNPDNYPFRRSYKPEWSGGTKLVQRINAGWVVDTSGREWLVKRVLPVPRDAGRVDLGFLRPEPGEVPAPPSPPPAPPAPPPAPPAPRPRRGPDYFRALRAAYGGRPMA